MVKHTGFIVFKIFSNVSNKIVIMKTLIISLLAVLMGGLICSFESRPGHSSQLYATGAPGEATCTPCHGTGANVFVQAPQTYQPGQHVLVILGIQGDSMVEAGAQLTIIDTLGNTRGSFLPGNYLNTPSTPIHYANSRAYLEHDNPLKPAWNNHAFMGMTYVADPTYLGPLSIYASGVSTNNDGTILGDQAASTVHVMEVPAPLALPEVESQDTTILKPKLHLSVVYRNGQALIRGEAKEDPYHVLITDMAGNTIFKGFTHLPTVLNISLPSGLYAIRAQHDELAYPITNKFVSQ
jgi:hypothetical protein